MVIGNADVPFEQFDVDSQTVDTTGGTLAALFTNLDHTKTRGIMIQNMGAVNLKLGKDTSGAKWTIVPGAVLTLYPKDLAKLFIKAASATCVTEVMAIY